MFNVTSIAEKLRSSSLRNSFDTFKRVSYQEKLNTDRFQFPEKHTSLYYHPIYCELSDEQKWRLSLLESAHFFSINIYGEQALVSEMESRLYRNKRIGECAASSKYMQHFIHEENSHTFMLAEYCMRYHGGLFQNRNMAVAKPILSPCAEDLLFYGRTFVLESFLGFINRKAQQESDLDITVKELHHCHLSDEVRHMAWDRAMIQGNMELVLEMSLLDELAVVRGLIETYINYNFRLMFNPHIYKMVGLEQGMRYAREASETPARKQLEAEWKKEIYRHFSKLGLF
ncbi:MAG: diiron oxygenase [Pseudomonas sp.]